MTADSQANPNVLFFLPSLSALSGSKELTTAYTQARVEQAHTCHRSTKGLLYTCFSLTLIKRIDNRNLNIKLYNTR